MKMTKKEIQSLIDRYFEANTSLKEETLLRTYFQSDEIDESLRMYKAYFNYFQEKKLAVVPKNIEAEVLETIQTEPQMNHNPPKTRRVISILSKIAAVFVLSFGFWFLYQHQLPKASKTTAIDWSKYEVKSDKEALEVMRMAFDKTSLELKKGKGIATQEIYTTKQRWSFLK